ncbi:uncharacterized protein LOC6534173 [Drosophila yakuba]|uniref:MYND-type domain-containing protein n=1 Tax=Drosophila yakuba TaxID=7245 RepID=B4PIL2_DROYA|nr:uncharacterized protein LOC6534173 [Drosophila yakuba]EDW94569.1 uncharacterized protein Dyak_GE22051 [Drosophila yakuba]
MNQSAGVHKKKPRIRNRQRNKINQVQQDHAESPDAPDAPFKSNGSQAATVIQSELPVGNHLPNGNPLLELLSRNGEVENPQEIDTIRLIQQLLRRKLLAKNSVVPSSENKPPTDQVKIVTQPKEIKSEEKKPKISTASVTPKTKTESKASVLSKEEEINDLLKCLGSKLPKGAGESPAAALFSNLGKLFSQAPPSDVESSDEEVEEYVEYIYKPRQYFMASLCNFCKSDLCAQNRIPCSRCGLSYYCSSGHMKDDQEHRQLCYALRQTVDRNGHEMFYKCGDFSDEQFRSYRIVCIRQVEKEMNRQLTATERELLLFPLICAESKCREHRFKRLSMCGGCGEVAFCKDKLEHRGKEHAKWCGSYQIFKAFIMFQEKFGRMEPSLPNKILRELPMTCSNTRQMMKKLNFNVTNECEYAALTQVSTGPLTAWFALKLCERLRNCEEMTLHLIGAEIEFEADMLQKWELFLLHITPTVKTLNVVFVGPELNPNNISFEQLKKIKCCRSCRKAQRTVNYHFENSLYHNYCGEASFLKPNLICFFNCGLYRSTGFALEDTWPETIQAALNLNCPIVVTSYTKYEAPLDMVQFINQSNRHLNVVMPPTVNPFTSEKPERNFISDNEAPFMFKNFYCFVVD